MSDDPSYQKPKRSVRSRLLEFLFWAAIAVGTAGVMIANTERILPANNF